EHIMRTPVTHYSWERANAQRDALLARHTHLSYEECFQLLNAVARDPTAGSLYHVADARSRAPSSLDGDIWPGTRSPYPATHLLEIREPMLLVGSEIERPRGRVWGDGGWVPPRDREGHDWLTLARLSGWSVTMTWQNATRIERDVSAGSRGIVLACDPHNL